MGFWAHCLAAATLLAHATTAHGYASLSNATLQNLRRPNGDFDVNQGALLSPILKPRVPGTPGIEEVRQHFLKFWADNLPSWTVTQHNSTSVTPVDGGTQVDFVNLIFRLSPPGVADTDVDYLTLAAHYDSKRSPEGFIGATDSAAPCAMLMHVARELDAPLTQKWAAEGAGDHPDGYGGPRGLQILLLDGEEAFESWTDNDSVYGARALAEEWETTVHPFYATYRNPLDQVSLFVLLDLLGLENPAIPSYFKTTHWAYQHLADVETRLRGMGVMFSRHPDRLPDEAAFMKERNKKDTEYWLGGAIGDDHTPFMQRGVEVMHLIPHPFPWVWHKKEDDGAHLDYNTTNDWAVLMTAFTAEWLELDTYMPKAEETVVVVVAPDTPALQRKDARDEL